MGGSRSRKPAILRQSFGTEFEEYLKTGSGKSFAYKRLVPVALEKDFSGGSRSSPKTRYSEVERKISKS